MPRYNDELTAIKTNMNKTTYFSLAPSNYGSWKKKVEVREIACNQPVTLQQPVLCKTYVAPSKAKFES